MRNFLEGVKFRLMDLEEYKKSTYRISFDMLTLQDMIAKCKHKNLKQEMCTYYNELFLLKERMKK